MMQKEIHWSRAKESSFLWWLGAFYASRAKDMVEKKLLIILLLGHQVHGYGDRLLYQHPISSTRASAFVWEVFFFFVYRLLLLLLLLPVHQISLFLVCQLLHHLPIVPTYDRSEYSFGNHLSRAIKYAYVQPGICEMLAFHVGIHSEMLAFQ